MNNEDVFKNMSIPKAVAKNAIPAIVSMLVVLIYNLADTFFVGQIGDPLQVAAVSITTPVFIIFIAFGTLFGVGGTSAISRAFGKGESKYAKNISSFCFYSSLISGIFIIVLFYLFMDTILNLIGSSPETVGYAKKYLYCVTLSAPFVIVSNTFANILRAEGKAIEALIGTLIGTIINIVLDPIMILTMGMGVFGAALATVIGNIFGTIYYIVYFLRKKSMLSISIKDFKIKDGVMAGVLSIGIPASFNNLFFSIANIMLNNVLAGYGDTQLAGMGVASKVSMIIALVLIGLGQGIQPLLGYSFGAKDEKRFKGILKFSIMCAFIMGVILTGICWIWTEDLVLAFIKDEEVFNYGVMFVKALIVSGPFLGVFFVFVNTLQACGSAIPSLILTISRQGFVFVPALYILNKVFGLKGVAYSQPFADYVSLIIAFLFCLSEVKKMTKVSREIIE